MDYDYLESTCCCESSDIVAGFGFAVVRDYDLVRRFGLSCERFQTSSQQVRIAAVRDDHR